MKRLLCISALFALVLIPDWASACWRRGGASSEGTYYGRPYFGRASYGNASYGNASYGNAYYAPLRRPIFYARQPAYQPVYVQTYPAMPAAPAAMLPPRIEVKPWPAGV